MYDYYAVNGGGDAVMLSGGSATASLGNASVSTAFRGRPVNDLAARTTAQTTGAV